MRVLAATGALGLIVEEVDKVIDAIKHGQKPPLPKLVVDANKAVEAVRFVNPYAKQGNSCISDGQKVADITGRSLLQGSGTQRIGTIGCRRTRNHEISRQTCR